MGRVAERWLTSCGGGEGAAPTPAESAGLTSEQEIISSISRNSLQAQITTNTRSQRMICLLSRVRTSRRLVRGT